MFKQIRKKTSSITLLFTNIQKNLTKIFILIFPKVRFFDQYYSFDKDRLKMNSSMSLKIITLLQYQILHVPDLKYSTIRSFDKKYFPLYSYRQSKFMAVTRNLCFFMDMKYLAYIFELRHMQHVL